MDTPREGNDDAIKSPSRTDQSLFTIVLDKGRDGLGDLKLVRVRVWRLCFLESLNRSRAQLKVLLYAS